MVGHVKPYNSV